MGDPSFASLPDEELMSRLARDEMEALGVLYERYDGMVKAALIRFAPSLPRAEIEELTQDVFLTLRDSVTRYEERMKFKAWLYGIAVRKAKSKRHSNWLRAKLLGQRKGENIAMAVAHNTSPEHRTEVRQVVRQALESLPAGQQEVLMLHAVDGFTGEEIAEILDIKPKTVWTRLHRARQAMRDALHDGAGRSAPALGGP